MKLTVNLIRKTQKGFTLIELLIVIAILGVLAAAVLAALNPIEQINRGKDAGRISSVSQLGHAMDSYFTTQALAAYPSPATATQWEEMLVTAGELKQVVKAPALANGNTCDATYLEQNNGDICYKPVGTPANDAVIWTLLESSANTTKAGCDTASGQVPAVVWIASQGKTGLDCLASKDADPDPADTLK